MVGVSTLFQTEHSSVISPKPGKLVTISESAGFPGDQVKNPGNENRVQKPLRFAVKWSVIP